MRHGVYEAHSVTDTKLIDQNPQRGLAIGFLAIPADGQETKVAVHRKKALLPDRTCGEKDLIKL